MIFETSWALVTGASSGLGIELAEGLARRGSNLVLTARSEPEMQALAARLREDHGVKVIVEPLDLSEQGSAAILEHRLDVHAIEPDILINNAGFGLYQPFLDHDSSRLRAMLQLDIVSLVELSHIFGRRMAARKRGRIMLVASVAAFQPVPHLAAYAAAKAFVLSLGEALHAELAPGVTVTVLSPGVMDTGFNAVSGFAPPTPLAVMKLAPAAVAEMGLKAMFAGKSGLVAGRLNRIMTLAGRLLPRALIARLALPRTKASATSY